MTVNDSIRVTVGDSSEPKRDLGLKEENIKNCRKTFKRHLKQFNLLGICEPDEVLTEAYLRFKTLHKEKKVPDLKLEAWIKGIGFNIVREMSRKRQKQNCQNLDPNILESIVASDEDISLNLIKQEESERVHDAVQKLSPENQQLINLRFFLELSWQEIAQHLNQNGNKVAVATLRKRGERAINELRKVYFENLP